MEVRFNHLLLIGNALTALLLGAVTAHPAAAADNESIIQEQEQIIQPSVSREPVTIADIDTENFEVGLYSGVMILEDFGSNGVNGLRVAYHFSESFFIEGAYGETEAGKTSYEILSGPVDLLTPEERQFNYYNLSLGFNILPGEAFVGRGLAFNSALYIIAGSGSTKFAGDHHSTINYGFGYRLLLTDWLAFHLDTRNHLFELDLLGQKKTTQNMEIHTGLTLFF